MRTEAERGGELRVGLIGYGAIGRVVADAILAGRAGDSTLIAILVLGTRIYSAAQRRALRDARVTLTVEPTCFFEGSARAAASHFQKSTNITAMLALCTAGLDNTRVRLVADPAAEHMRTSLEFRSDAGKLRLEWQSRPSHVNPSTSVDVPLTIVKALRNLASPVHYGI
jgi:aspartate dehydrogenase